MTSEARELTKITPRQLRHVLYPMNPNITIRELREILFDITEQDKEYIIDFGLMPELMTAAGYYDGKTAEG